MSLEHSSSQPETRASNPAISRRRFVQTLGAAAGGLLLSDQVFAAGDIRVDFDHGVASGDPMADRVVIWTRATSPQASAFYLLWLVATDPDMNHVVTGGLAHVDPAFDNTVKIDVGGLQPDTTYYYQFIYRQYRSPVGRTRTLTDGPLEHARIAFVSCSNHSKGFFNAYAELAKMDDVTLVLHLGDYIYEYGQDGYVTTANALLGVPQPRLDQLAPPHECVSLQDYRTRYALYRSDPNLQAVHQAKAFVCIWDDHETANNAWVGGAENHQNDEGAWLARRDAGIRAFYEWLPIREPESGERIQGHRSFRFGDLARLMVVETRLQGRDLQLNALSLVGAYAGATADGRFPQDVNAQGAPRGLLGEEQKAWLRQELAEASAQQTWQLLGQQMLFFFQPAPDFLNSSLLTEDQKAQLIQGIDALFGLGTGRLFGQIGAEGGPNPIAADAWTGYPSAKLEMTALLAQVPNPVLVCGDSHNSWAADIKLPTPQGPLPVAVEFGGTSVSSPGYEEELVMLTPDQTAGLFLESSQANPLSDDLIYAETSLRGFSVLDITHQRVRCEWYFLDTVLSPDYTLSLGKTLEVERDARRIKAD